MELELIKEIENELTVKVSGRLDTTTAPELEEALLDEIENIEKLTLDLSDLEYISSAGLRVLLSAQKIMMKKGEMILTNVTPSVMEVLEMTGFADILTIEEAEEKDEEEEEDEEE